MTAYTENCLKTKLFLFYFEGLSGLMPPTHNIDVWYVLYIGWVQRHLSLLQELGHTSMLAFPLQVKR